MKIAFLILALLSLPTVVFAGESPADTAASEMAESPVPQKPTVHVKVTVSGAVDIVADKAKTIYAEFVSSDKATNALRTAFTAAGYTLASSRVEANVVYVVDGAFQALRPATQRTAEIRAGEYVEKPEPPKTKSGKGPTLVVGDLFTTIVGTIGENLGTLTGVRDAFNNAVVGDPDGKCLANCYNWKYQQSSVINIKRIVQGEERTMTLIAEAITEDLVPSLLFQNSLQGLENAAGIKLDAVLGETPAKTSSL